MTNWTFLTHHARVLLCVAHDPGVRLRDIAASVEITERSAFGIITDLVEAGYVAKKKDGRRNRYHIQAHLPLPEWQRHDGDLKTGRGERLAEVQLTLPGVHSSSMARQRAHLRARLFLARRVTAWSA